MYESVKNPFGRSSMFWGNDSDYYKFNEVIFPRKGSVSSPFLSHPFHSLACLSHSLSLPSLFSVFLSFIYTYTEVLITDFSTARHPLIFSIYISVHSQSFPWLRDIHTAKRNESTSKYSAICDKKLRGEESS